MVRAALLAAALSLPAAAHAQLRPLEPLDWNAFAGVTRIELRVAYLNAQRASLAGTEGQLFEVGEFRATIPIRGVLLELAGTPQRFLFDEEVYAEPTGGARPVSENRRRKDSGDYRVGAAFRLAALKASDLVLRFGTRLPTTDNLVGLERDQTDFFGLLGGRLRVSGINITGEAGVGINGTRLTAYEQSDVLLYSFRAEMPGRIVVPHVILTGQNDLKSREIRGNEDLSELRVGMALGRQKWLTTSLVVGLEPFSPAWGVLIGGGFEF